MKVVLAEKPSVAKSIAETVGAKQRNDGYFEGNGYQVTWAFGHLVTLSSPEEVIGKKISLDDLPILPSQITLKLKDDKTGGVKKQYNTIKKLFGSADEIICATDAGREGELIFRLIYEYAKCTKDFKRLWISSINPEVIKNGLSNLKPGKNYDALYQGGRLRQLADWYVGFNCSIAMTQKNGYLLKIGRVKTPTLFLVVKRYLENSNFKSTPFFIPKIKIENFNKQSLIISYDDRFKTIEEASKLESLIRTVGKTELIDIEAKEKTTAPPSLFNLAELQKQANKQFGYTANETLTELQVLYENGYVSYPRTDSRFLNEEMQEEVFETLEKIGNYFKCQDSVLPLLLQKNLKPFDNSKVTDHHAIIPTSKFPVLESLNEKQKNVYLMILTSFLQSFSTKEVRNVSVYTFTVENIDITFSAKGSVLINAGFTIFKDLFFPKKNTTNENEDEAEDKELPIFTKGFYPVLDVLIQEGKTAPPPLLNDASLISLMESCGKEIDDKALRDVLQGKGIGTSATRGGIIEELVNGDYIIRKGKSLIPSRLGFEVVKALNGQKICSAQLTGEWEDFISHVEDGSKSVEEFNHEIINYTKDITNNLLALPKLAYNPFETEHNCPLCSSAKLLQNKNTYYCENAACGYTIWKNYRFAIITEKRLRDLLTKGITTNVKCKSKDDKTYTVDLKLHPDTKQIESVFSNNKPISKFKKKTNGTR